MTEMSLEPDLPFTFSPFVGVLYNDPLAIDDGVMELDTVIAPFNVRDDENQFRSCLERNAYNAAHLIQQPSLAYAWQEAGWLSPTAEASLYLYKVGFNDANGMPRQWSSVFGVVDTALSRVAVTSPEDEGASGSTIQLMPQLIEVAAEGFSELLVPVGMPLARATDQNGAHHRLWPLKQSGVISLVADAVINHGHPSVQRLEPGRLVLAYESTEPFIPPALGMVMTQPPQT